MLADVGEPARRAAAAPCNTPGTGQRTANPSKSKQEWAAGLRKRAGPRECPQLDRRRQRSDGPGVENPSRDGGNGDDRAASQGCLIGRRDYRRMIRGHGSIYTSSQQQFPHRRYFSWCRLVDPTLRPPGIGRYQLGVADRLGAGSKRCLQFGGCRPCNGGGKSRSVGVR